MIQSVWEQRINWVIIDSGRPKKKKQTNELENWKYWN